MTALIMGAPKAALSIVEFCEHVGIGRTTCYAEIKVGRLKTVKVGRRTLVTAREVQEWLQRLSNGGVAA
jgi:excisionase family DNA binding protein